MAGFVGLPRTANRWSRSPDSRWASTASSAFSITVHRSSKSIESNIGEGPIQPTTGNAGYPRRSATRSKRGYGTSGSRSTGGARCRWKRGSLRRTNEASGTTTTKSRRRREYRVTLADGRPGQSSPQVSLRQENGAFECSRVTGSPVACGTERSSSEPDRGY